MVWTGRVTPPDRDGGFISDGRETYVDAEKVGDGDERPSLTFEAPGPEQLLALGRAGYSQGSTWRDMALRQQWDDALRMFHSQHISGSKYLDDSYRNRSRLFRPKTRSVVRKGEAAVQAAFFSTKDAVEIEPENEESPTGRASAAFYKALTDFHLRKSIPWYFTVVGAYQTATVMGACFTKQYWSYEVVRLGERQVKRFDELMQEERPVFEVDELTGDNAPVMETVWGVRTDQPACDPIRPENVLFDPSADCRCPIQASPYMIVIHPMVVIDVKNRMRLHDAKTGQPIWKELADGAIASAKMMTADETTQAREGPDRPDPNSHARQISDHDIVEVREHFYRWDGIDWHWFSLGDAHLLTDAAPTHERYPHLKPGERPITMGVVNFEALVAFPRSKINLTAAIQHETNDLANLRIDGLRLTLQPRMKARAGRVTNPEAMRRVDPGEPFWVRDMADVEWDKAPPVDAAAYAEQDRLNNDFDELSGNFSSSSVMTNRKMNETVGGMKLLSAGATQIGDYEIRNFSESWYGPTMSQIVRLVQRFETNEARMTIAADRAKLAKRWGVTEMDDDFLDQDLEVKVNDGPGAADPDAKLQRLAGAFQILSAIAGPIVEAIGPSYLFTPAFHEIAKEVFGLAGYRDCERFLDFGEPPKPQTEGADPAQLEADMAKEQLRARTTKDVTKMNLAGALMKQMIAGEQQQSIKAMEHAHQAHSAAQDRAFTAGEGERDRGFQREQGAEDRSFQREQTQGGQQHERAMAEMQGLSGTPTARKPKINPPALSPAAQARAAEGGGEEAAGWGQPATAPPQRNEIGMPMPAAPDQTQQHLARLDQVRDTIGGAQADMVALGAMLEGFVRATTQTLRAMRSQIDDIGANVDEIQRYQQAPRSIVTRGKTRILKIGDQEREITVGPDGSVSV